MCGDLFAILCNRERRCSPAAPGCYCVFFCIKGAVFVQIPFKGCCACRYDEVLDVYRQHVYALRRCCIAVERSDRRRILHAFMLARSLPTAGCPCLRACFNAMALYAWLSS